MELCQRQTLIWWWSVRNCISSPQTGQKLEHVASVSIELKGGYRCFALLFPLSMLLVCKTLPFFCYLTQGLYLPHHLQIAPNSIFIVMPDI